MWARVMPGVGPTSGRERACTTLLISRILKTLATAFTATARRWMPSRRHGHLSPPTLTVSATTTLFASSPNATRHAAGVATRTTSSQLLSRPHSSFSKFSNSVSMSSRAPWAIRASNGAGRHVSVYRKSGWVRGAGSRRMSASTSSAETERSLAVRRMLMMTP